MTSPATSRRTFLKTILANAAILGHTTKFSKAQSQNNGIFLYVSNFMDNSISVFQVNSDSSLRPLGQPFRHRNLNRNDRIESIAHGNFLCVSNLASPGGISIFAVGTHGELVPFEGPPLLTGSMINDFVLRTPEAATSEYSAISARPDKVPVHIYGYSPRVNPILYPELAPQVGIASMHATILSSGVRSQANSVKMDARNVVPQISVEEHKVTFAESHTGFSQRAAIQTCPKQTFIFNVGVEAEPSTESTVRNFINDSAETIVERFQVDPVMNEFVAHDTVMRVQGVSTAIATSDEGFAYVPNRDQNHIQVIGPTGRQVEDPIPNSPGASGPNGAIIHPNGQWLFLTNHNTSNVSVFNIMEDGSLEPGPGPFLTFGNNMTPQASGEPTVSQDGKRLYVTNPQSNDLTVFNINEDTGELTFVSTFPTGRFPLGVEEVTPSL